MSTTVWTDTSVGYLPLSIATCRDVCLHCNAEHTTCRLIRHTAQQMYFVRARCSHAGFFGGHLWCNWSEGLQCEGVSDSQTKAMRQEPYLLPWGTWSKVWGIWRSFWMKSAPQPPFRMPSPVHLAVITKPDCCRC